MPIYEYAARDRKKSCGFCLDGFEMLMKLSDPPLEHCPKCGAPVEKLVSRPSVGGSRSGFDQRAKEAGFHKLEKRGTGEYEKKY